MFVEIAQRPEYRQIKADQPLPDQWEQQHGEARHAAQYSDLREREWPGRPSGDFHVKLRYG